jgi:hypothetical protein
MFVFPLVKAKTVGSFLIAGSLGYMDPINAKSAPWALFCASFCNRFMILRLFVNPRCPIYFLLPIKKRPFGALWL